MKLSESQRDVVEFLQGLPGAAIIRVREEASISPYATDLTRARGKMVISGGGTREAPCPCGNDCGHTKREQVYAEFEWRDGIFYAARQSARDKNRSITEVKELTRKKLGIIHEA